MLPIAAEADTKIFSCEYSSYSDEKGHHKNIDIKKQAIFVDEDDEIASLMVDGETYDYQLVISGDRVIFYQVTNDGSFNSITIDKNMDVVYSRNTLQDGLLAPSQYYGKCSAK